MIYLNNTAISHAYLGNIQLQNIALGDKPLLARVVSKALMPLKNAVADKTIYVDKIYGVPVYTTELGSVEYNSTFLTNTIITNEDGSCDLDFTGNKVTDAEARIVYGIKRYREPDMSDPWKYLHVDYLRYNSGHTADVNGTKMKFTKKVGEYWGYGYCEQNCDVYLDIHALNTGPQSVGNLYLYPQWNKGLVDGFRPSDEVKDQIGDKDNGVDRTDYLACPELRAGWSSNEDSDSVLVSTAKFIPMLYTYEQISTYTLAPETPEPIYSYVPVLDEPLDLFGMSKDGYCYLFEYTAVIDELYCTYKDTPIYICLGGEYIRVEIERFVDTGTIGEDAGDNNCYYFNYADGGVVFPYLTSTPITVEDGKPKFSVPLGLLTQYGPERLNITIDAGFYLVKDNGVKPDGGCTTDLDIDLSNCAAAKEYAFRIHGLGAAVRPAYSSKNIVNYTGEYVCEKITLEASHFFFEEERAVVTDIGIIKITNKLTYPMDQGKVNELCIAKKSFRKTGNTSNKITFNINDSWKWGSDEEAIIEATCDGKRGSPGYDLVEISISSGNYDQCEITFTDISYYYDTYLLTANETHEIKLPDAPHFIYFKFYRSLTADERRGGIIGAIFDENGDLMTDEFGAIIRDEDISNMNVKVEMEFIETVDSYTVNNCYSLHNTPLPLNAINEDVYDYFDLINKQHVKRCGTTETGGLTELEEEEKTPLTLESPGIEIAWPKETYLFTSKNGVINNAALSSAKCGEIEYSYTPYEPSEE